jgi:hypothetical protein
MRLVHFAEATEQRADIVPLNIVIQRVAENLLQCEAVVVVQLGRHSQPLNEGRGLLPSKELSTL